MGKRWYREHRRDPYYRRAKAENYRSRAAYKLLQINERFHIIKEGDVVVDLGAAPGGWSQVALSIVGEKGLVVGVDLQRAKPMDGWVFIRGDFTRQETVEKILDEIKKWAERWAENNVSGKKIGGRRLVDVVISDMSPNISGIYDVDQARSIDLATHALRFAVENLRPGGNFVCKVFQGRDTEGFVAEARKRFHSVKRYSPPASRKSSSEVYIICRGKKTSKK